MRSIFVLLILVMIGLNGKGQSVTALPDSVLSQCCLEVTLLNGNVTTVDWVFVQYITRDGTGTKLFVEYAPNFGGIQWETQIRIQDDFDDVLERSKFIVIPFTVGSTDYGINRNWIANIEENTTTGGTWIYGRFGTPTKRKFSAVEDYETMKSLLLACRPRAIVVAENGLYTEGDTVRMGGFLIENTSITTEGYNWQMKDTLSSVEFGLDYLTPETLDTTVYWARRHGSLRQMVQLGRRYYYNSMRDTVGGLYSDLTHSWNAGDPFLQYQVFNPSAPTTGTAWFKIQKDNSFLNLSNDATNPYYSLGWAVTNTTASLGASESGSGDPGNGVVMGAYGFGTTEFLFMKTKAVDAGTATNGQYLQLIDNSSGEVDFATIDLSAYLPIADTAAMLDPYIQGAGTLNYLPKFTAGRVIGNSNLFDNNTYAGVIGRPWKFGEYTTAGLPTGVTGYHLFNTTLGYTIFYDGTQYLPVGFWSKSGSNLSYLLGKVGIGQSSPTATLDIKEAAQTTSMVDIYNPSQTPYAMRIFNEAYSTSNPVFAYFAYNNGRFAMGNLQAADYELFVNGYTNPSLTILGSNGAIKIGGNSGVTGNTYLFKNGNIGMGTASPSYTLDIAWTDAARFFGGTTAQRPTRAARLIRYNSDSLGFEIANSTTWLKLLNRTDLIFQNSRSGNNVSIRIPGGTGTTFSVSDPDTLTVSGSTLSVSGGNSVTLPWLKTQLESGQSVHIKATTGDTLSIKNAPIQLKGSTGATAILLSPAGVVELRKDNYLDFRDTITTMEMYSAIKNSVSNPTYMGVGWENTLYHPELGTPAAPGSRFRRLQSILADTTGASGILRIWNGPEYQGATIKTTQTFFGLGEAEPSFTFISRSTGNGNPAFQMKAVNPFFEIKQNGGFYAGADSSLKFNATLKTLQLSAYGTSATTAAALSKTQSNYAAGFATDGTVTSLEVKRDTTIYVVDTDYDFSAALTTAQVSARYNRVIFLMTTTAAAGSNSDLTLHTPDVNLMQCEYLIRSTDEAGGFTNTIQFGSNNAVQSDNTLTGTYTPSPGQGVGIRAGLRSGVYKYFYY